MGEPPRHESFIELGVLADEESPARVRTPVNPAGRRLLRHRGYALTALLLVIMLVTASMPWPTPTAPVRPELLSGEPLLLGSLITQQSPGGFGVAAYRVRDGKPVWRLPFERGFVERLAVLDATLVIGAFRADSPEPDGERLVLGVDAGSGELRWSWPGLLLAQDGQVAAVIDRAAGRIWGFTARTGQLRWSLDLGGQDAVTAARFPQPTEELLVSGPGGGGRLVELSSGAVREVPGRAYGEIPIWLDRGLLMTGRPDDMGTSGLHRYAFYESRSMTRLWETLADSGQTPEPCRPHICLVIEGVLSVHARSTGEVLWTSQNGGDQPASLTFQRAAERDAAQTGGRPLATAVRDLLGDLDWRVAGAQDGSLLVVASGAVTPDQAPWIGTVLFDRDQAGEPNFVPLVRLPSVLDGFGTASRPDLRGAWLLCPARSCAVPVRLTPADLADPRA